eukprot:8888473-Pyramimonas_sp.AAC.1
MSSQRSTGSNLLIVSARSERDLARPLASPPHPCTFSAGAERSQARRQVCGRPAGNDTFSQIAALQGWR